MHLNESYWNNRYKTKTTTWDLGEVSPPLKAYFDQLENKHLKVLIPGGGHSYEAEYLFKKGYHNVFLVDISKTALFNFKRRVPDFPKTNLVHMDFFKFSGEFDLCIEQTFFCALNPKLRPNYVNKMSELLKDSGQLVGVLFDIPMQNESPPFGGNMAEYLQLFSSKFKINTIAPCYNSIKSRLGRELFINFEKKQFI